MHPQMEDKLKWKTTSNGRLPQMEYDDDIQWIMTYIGRKTPMEYTTNGREPP
jgi:hypothetical protein